MEGNLLVSFLAFMGGLSLYLVIATLVGKAVYSRTKDWGGDERFAAAIFCGGLFPISVPVIILVLWVRSIVFVQIDDDQTENDTTKQKSSPQELDVVKNKTKTKFKVGDLVTGTKGNPGGYNTFYEGCVCRVLEIDKDEQAINLKLIDHIDRKANEEEFGQVAWAPEEHFTLIKPKKTESKEVVKKKKK